ncbi:MAG: peptidoglycan-binding protein [Candidatus Omnitrophica bacterium]|nr:peptidoglycan-binding protein [Candidatus Omnitrophota bacterium]
MGLIRAGIAGIVIIGLSGCAGGKMNQEVKRLQSQVGLLDQRVTQLERTGGTWQASDLLSEPAPTGAIVPQPVAKSSKDAAVAGKPSTRDIQQALKNSGFYQGSIDGKMGPLTREAVKEFQRVHGLKDDGVVGKQTWAQLSPYTTLSSDSGQASAAEFLK